MRKVDGQIKELPDDLADRIITLGGGLQEKKRIILNALMKSAGPLGLSASGYQWQFPCWRCAGEEGENSHHVIFEHTMGIRDEGPAKRVCIGARGLSQRTDALWSKLAASLIPQLEAVLSDPEAVPVSEQFGRLAQRVQEASSS